MMALLRLKEDGRLSLKSPDGTERDAISRSAESVLLVVDTSGSMAGNKIEQAKQGAVDFARSANKQGCATALAIFGDRAAMVCDPTFETAVFERKVSRLTVGLVGGTTNLAAALHLAGKFAQLNAVVIVTDGQADSESAALAAAELLKGRNIDILCIGTDDADKSFLAKLATRADLAVHVNSQDLRTAISSASRLLLGTR